MGQLKTMVILALAIMISGVSMGNAHAKPIALVYRGPGACTNCWTSAAQTAKKAGFRVRLVNDQLKDFSVFNQAALWVQPGGKSTTAARAMGADYLARIRDFVHQGGGYIGFCAGAFIATEKIGTSGMEGLGIVPGKTKLWDPEDGPGRLIQVSWNHRIRSVYYHGGPFLDFGGVRDPSLQVYSQYENGQNAGAILNYGQGRVAVSGAHPEASRVWKGLHFQRDEDGSDQHLVAKLMRWAAQLSDGIE
jgi:glutamine amidotransferase-like uncharacterized protein